METDAGLARPRRRRRRAVPWLASIGVAAAVLGLYALDRSTVPYDPLASPFPAAVTYDGLKPGQTVTVVFPISSSGTEHVVLLGAVPAGHTAVRRVGIFGDTRADGIALWMGGPRVPRFRASTVGPLRPIRHLAFGPPTATAPWRHAWIAMTVRVEGTGCIPLPPIRLRYVVGSTEFTRVVNTPVGISTPGDDHDACTRTLFG